ncbi:MAG: enoyl-CoA hydratase [Pseudolabrys sp.]|nr:enoyl-CoA hydratase [Pseudolabrys sp.]
MTSTDKMLTHKEGSVGYITFNNPEKRNAVSLDMWEACEGHLDKFRHDNDVHVVVVTGAGGKAFVSGADISKFGEERASKEASDHYNEVVDRVNAAFTDFPKPTIAMIRGYCIGGGMGLALTCDMRICTEGSSFAVPAAKLSIGYRYTGLKKLVDLVGPSFAKEIFYTARQFTAPEALAMGLVNRVVANGELESYVRNYAETIAGNAPLTIRTVKYMIGQMLSEEPSDLETAEKMVQECFASNDFIEGRTAFMEKRKPKFTGK